MDESAAPPGLAGKRVAIFSHSHPSLTKGGAEIAAHTLFRGLRAAGVDAILIAACEEDLLDSIALGPNEFALPYRGAVYDHLYHIAPIGVRRTLVDLLRAQHIDILNAHHFLHVGVSAFADVAAAGVRIVFTIHEFLAICHNHGQLVTRHANALCEGPTPAACRACYPERSSQQFAMRQRHIADALADVAAFVSPSRFLADKMVEQGVPESRMTMIENGVAAAGDRSPPRRTGARRIWKFGYFGQINPFKGLDLLLDACSLIARDVALSAQVRVVVHGGFVGQSEAFVARFKAAVEQLPFLTYVGAYDNRHVGRLMAECDYVLMTSTWWENSPVVIQEAFRAGCPVICTGIGGMAEKVTDGVSGLHFTRNDASDLADRIAEAADPALHDTLKAGLPTPPTPDDMAGAYAALFAEVVNTPLTV
jgi:glycosyltransferase involved in cell wall biosynthesis